MKFSEEGKNTEQRIQAYGEDWVRVNNQQLNRACIVSHNQLLTDWKVTHFSQLEPVQLKTLLDCDADVFIIGTGKKQQLPSPTIHRALVEQGKGFEIMTTAAACRTYNVLLGEGRKVACALFFDSGLVA